MEATASHVDLVPEVASGVAVLTASLVGLIALLVVERVAARRAKPQRN